MYKYKVNDKDGRSISRLDTDTGLITIIPVDPANMDYHDMVMNKITPDPYVAPTDTAPILTIEEKLKVVGLTPEDIKQAVDIATKVSVTDTKI